MVCGPHPVLNPADLDLSGLLQQRHQVTKILHFLSHQLAFGGFQLQAALLKPIEHQLQSLQMFIKGFREYDEVIQINQEVSEVQIPKAAVHESLEGGGGILQSKGHSVDLKQPHWRTECCLVFVMLRHLRLQIS